VLVCSPMMTKETTTCVCIAATDEHTELDFFFHYSLVIVNMKNNKLATHGLHTDHTYTTASVLQFS
jgi:hypothetical protein